MDSTSPEPIRRAAINHTLQTNLDHLDHLVCWFTPNTAELGLRQYAAHRLLVYICLITTLFALLYVATSLAIGFTIGVVLMLLDFVLLWAILFWFRSTGRFRACANVYIFTCAFVAVLGCSFFTGGNHSPVLPWFTLIPVTAVLLLGYGRDALLWLLVACAVPIIYGAAAMAGYQFVTLYNLEYVNVFSMICLTGLVLILFIAMVKEVTEGKRARDEVLRLNSSLEERVQELHIQQQELHAARQAADAANSAKSQFLANMSHEIRTPMNSIMGMAYLALQAEINPKQRNYIQNIHTSSLNLLGIINDILDFSKIESGHLELESIDFNLEELFDNLSSQLVASASRKGLKLTFERDARLSLPLRGDPLRLRQILTNLISNAIKFSSLGGVIVRSTIIPTDAISVRSQIISTAEGEQRVRFEIQDSGIGLSAEQIQNLFQAFRQADTTITRKYGGTGLGLVISKRLAEMMGGEIGVKSQPGRGSTFWFSILLGRGEMTADLAHETSHPDLHVLKGAKILVVEDVPVNQMLAQELLEMQGVIVTLANNGLEALEIMLKQPFDCVLMDMQMPVMDGLEATRQIRANPAIKDTYIIAMTANARNEDSLRCKEAGMNDFITKPIDPKIMYSIVAKWVSASR